MTTIDARMEEREEIATDVLTDVPRTTQGAKPLHDQCLNTYDDVLKWWKRLEQ